MTSPMIVFKFKPKGDDLSPPFESEEVKIGPFNWKATGIDVCVKKRLIVKDFQVICSVDNKKSTIWSCRAKGRVTTSNGNPDRLGNDDKICKLWTGSFNFLKSDDLNRSSKLALKWGLHKDEIYNYELKPSAAIWVEVEVNLIKSHYVDLSSSENEMIEGPEDAVGVEVAGEKLWLSKKILSIHSPFFKALFSQDFNEKATETYELKEIELNEFLHFLALVYNVDAPIDHESVFYLMKLGDFFQCDAVIRRCEDYIVSSDAASMCLAKKIELCDGFDIPTLAEECVKKLTIAEVKKYFNTGNDKRLSEFTRDLMIERLSSE
ncbi:hypothetical protein QR680_007027 [Steinernema hermaphroditum]|uniref:BTB domain-containing protein n=1 Tax=Steinernema hermaphroditum TaxID=289476 RepID=A0AA39LYD9_9BILA|nr:hypothetical protein QR680_007027 [Steinernema hermaphroditum]